MSDYEGLLRDLDNWATVQPKAAKAIRELLARVAELEAAGERLWNELVAVRGVANKLIALEGRDDIPLNG